MATKITLDQEDVKTAINEYLDKRFITAVKVTMLKAELSTNYSADPGAFFSITADYAPARNDPQPRAMGPQLPETNHG